LHRIRHYGLFANGNRAANIARARELLAVASSPKESDTPETAALDEPRVRRAAVRAAVAGGSSSRPSRAVASRTTSPRLLQLGSGAIPHEAVDADPPSR
jgi:hypothetical protein